MALKPARTANVYCSNSATMPSTGSSSVDVAVADLRRFHLTDWIDGHPSWRSVSTRRARASAVCAVFAWGVLEQRIERHPFAGVRYAEHERRPDLPDADLERVYAVASKPYERVLRFLRLTGCRLSELCRATWGQFDLERGVWTIPLHKAKKFTGQAREVALTAGAVALLSAIAAATTAGHEAEAGRCVWRWERSAWPQRQRSSLTAAAGPGTAATLGQQLRRLKKRHGFDFRGTLHGVRHTSCTKQIANGAPIKLVAEQHGHSTTAITERYYWHRSDEHLDALRAAAEKGVEPHP
jgi:integrase